MGQYHYPVNLTKKEFFSPHKLGCGFKLVEQASWGAPGGVGDALILLCAASSGRGGGDFADDAESLKYVGRWAGDRIALVGDYAEDGDLPAEFKASTIYERCWGPRDGEEKPKGAYEDISDGLVAVLERAFEVVYYGAGWRKRVTLRDVMDFESTHRLGVGRVMRANGPGRVDYVVAEVIPALRAYLEKLPERQQWGREPLVKATFAGLGVKPYGGGA